jgi:pimeloyl-ACP methyl ester carboxylesterase
MVVGHSAASSLAWLAVDARPGKIGKAAFIGGWPAPDGELYFEGLPVKDGAVPFPGWDEFEGPDSADLDDAARQAFAAAAIPVPEGVTTGVVRLADPRRYAVPAVLICPEFSPGQVSEMISQGQLPELAKIRNLSLADIDSGHWPMITAPATLARLIDQAAAQS